jgi:hypothetical protein
VKEPQGTKVLDTYWRFAGERQAVFFNRLEGRAVWTTDPVLISYKFTNAYRASDRVSQFLLRNVIYSSIDVDWRSRFFRILLFKLFNKIETWDLLSRTLGEVTAASFAVDRYARILDDAMDRGVRLYSAAYVMPAAAQFRSPRKHRTHLELLARMMSDGLPERIAEARTMEAAYHLLRNYPMMGPFLSYQFITDLNYAPDLSYEESEFVVAGPGARDGLRKCFGDHAWSESDLIRWVAERQQHEFERRGVAFRDLWGRRLQLIDCQNLFCEVDKYSRVVHPSVAGISGRTRIKQKFASHGSLPDPFYPPKWKLVDRIDYWRAARAQGGSNEV